MGNAINVKDEIEWLKNEFGIDENVAIDYIKYYLSTETQFGSDGDYSRTRFIERINSELVNNIGNLIQRVLSMIYKNFDGKIECIETIDDNNINYKEQIEIETINKFNFQDYKNLILTISNNANNYMELTAPWNLKKENKIEELKIVLYKQMESIRKIAILLQVLCPYISKNILDFLDINDRLFINIYNNEQINYSFTQPQGFFPKLLKK